MTKFLTNCFFKSPPNDLSKNLTDHACVSLIFNEISSAENIYERLNLAFIRRAHNPHDPWSGQIAFPGGRKDHMDESDLSTALRETKEEVGWSLHPENFLGYLSDLQARNRQGLQNFFLRPLVFTHNQPDPLNLFDPQEVDEVFWIPLSYLQQSKHKTTIFLQDRNIELPAIRLPKGDKLWGLTYFMTQELLQRLASIKA